MLFRWARPMRSRFLTCCLAVALGHSSAPLLHAVQGGSNHHDHALAMALLDASDATHIARRDGAWSDPATWSSGMPGPNARVLVPPELTVTVDEEIETPIGWVRVEGALRFSPTADTLLQATTIVITPTGSLAIGAPDDRVRADKTARLHFLPRSAEERRRDHSDLAGGLIALGSVQLFGAQYDSFAVPMSRLNKNVSHIAFGVPPVGWRVGDQLLFPAANAGSEDELRRIASISDDRMAFELEAPLDFAHSAPDGVPARVPVGNLTRNVILASTETGELHQRGHVMLMAPTGIEISGAAFRGLGRTSAFAAHALTPGDDPDQGVTRANLIGRYAVHFHLVSGAARESPAQIFSGNAIVDSPKHGLVNHGGYVVAENNVTFAIHGSHFFTENGSEIGSFRNNLAVFSRGSGDDVRARKTGVADFGHGGHGFWSQSPAVTVEDNYAFHHAAAAYAIFAAGIASSGDLMDVHFQGTMRIANLRRENLQPPVQEVLAHDFVPPTVVPFRLSRNTAGNSSLGIEIWFTNLTAEHDLESVVEECVVWDAHKRGIRLVYGVNTRIRDSTLVGFDPLGCSEPACDGSIGITTEGTTRHLTIDNVKISGFTTGVRVPLRGVTEIKQSRFENKYNIRIFRPEQPGRQTILRGNSFARHADDGVDYHLTPGTPFNGDISMFFERDFLLVEDSRFPGKTVYFKDQHPAAIPFEDTGIRQLDGKTAGEIQAELGLAIGGMLAPGDAVELPGVGGLVGAPSSQPEEQADQEEMLARVVNLENEISYTSSREEGYSTDCCNIYRMVQGTDDEQTGWRFKTVRSGDGLSTQITYIDTTPPRFELDPRIELEIHPRDVRYGFVIEGTLHDENEGAAVIRKEYRDLTEDADGYVRVDFEYPDRAGNVFHRVFELEVTPEAVQRGANLSYYRQGAHSTERGTAVGRHPSG